jgi:hypothetical protein
MREVIGAHQPEHVGIERSVTLEPSIQVVEAAPIDPVEQLG